MTMTPPSAVADTSPAKLGRKRDSANGRMDGDELGAVGEGRLDLDLLDDVGHAFHHLLAPQHMRAGLPQIGDRAAIARALDHEIGDQRHGLGMVELHTALETAARHDGGHGDQKLVLLARRQIHRPFPPAGPPSNRSDYKRLHQTCQIQTCQTRGNRQPRNSVRKSIVARRTAVASPRSRATITPFTKVTPALTSLAVSRSVRAFSK